MKLLNKHLYALSLALFLNVSVTKAQVVDDSENLIGAATGCFPRVFSQINQFLSSSGGLRNTNANPRTIVCSLDINGHEEIGNTQTHRAFVLFTDNNSTQGTTCTFFIRDAVTGSLVDSVTQTFLFDGGGRRFLADVERESLTNFSYIQCTLPGNGRMTQIETYYFDPDA